MTAPALFIVALAGAMFGSFLTVVAHRVPRGESVVGGRSMCPSCGHQIAPYDNVPVLSWVTLRGRSRCCGQPISARYPLTEIALAAMFLGVVLRFLGDWGEIAAGFVFCATLLAITLTDLERRIIPNRVLLVSAGLGLAIFVASDPSSLPERLGCALGAGGILFVAAMAYPGGMGMGDVKLAAVMGLFLGVEVIPALLIALLAGSVVGIAMIVHEGATARKKAIPFGPFLALGGVTALFLGHALIELYLRAFT